jgi:hypothetical protein
MKKFILEFVRRGASACGLGPLVLAVLYLILERQGMVDTLTVGQMCVGIFSLTALAFVAGGMNGIYQIERLPLMAAVSIHGGMLYVAYLLTYLANDWLVWGTAPMLVFTGIFVLGYLGIWTMIYLIIRRKTRKLNEMLKRKQQFS